MRNSNDIETETFGWTGRIKYGCSFPSYACGLLLLAASVASPAHTAPEVFFSPNDDGIPGAAGLTIPSGQSTTLFLYIDPGSTSSQNSTPCADGGGEELCAWDLKLRPVGNVTFGSFVSDSDVVASSSAFELRLNGVTALTGILGPTRLGELSVAATADGSSVVLDASQSVNASLQLESIGARTLIPEPSTGALGGIALATLAGLVSWARRCTNRRPPGPVQRRWIAPLLCLSMISLVAMRAEAGLDSDADSVPDDTDNCPFESNSDQADDGGFDSQLPDGIGNACQCGDVNDDGIVDILDAAHMQRGINGLNPGLLDPFKCRVTLDGDCGASDLEALQIALADDQTGIEQACIAAGELMSCEDGQLDPGEQCDDGNAVDDDCCTNACTVLTGSCSDGDICTTADTCSAGACVGDPILDVFEPNEIAINAAFLGSIRDSDFFPSGFVTGSLSPAADEDWYRYDIEDAFAGQLNPRAELSNVPTGSTYQVCAFYACDSQTDMVNCDAGSPATSGSLLGCCADASPNATVLLDVSCIGFNDSGQAFVRITSASGPQSCDEYTLKWGDD